MTRNQWFAMLAPLAYPLDPERAAKAFVTFLPMLADFPDAAFNRHSLDHVVMAPRKMAMPTYDEIRRGLADWWRDNRPAGERLASEWPALPGPAPEEKRAPTPIEVEAVAHVVKAWKSDTAKKSAMVNTPQHLRPKALTLSDQALLAEYTAYAADHRNDANFRRLAELRVTLLLKKMGVMEKQPA